MEGIAKSVASGQPHWHSHLEVSSLRGQRGMQCPNNELMTRPFARDRTSAPKERGMYDI